MSQYNDKLVYTEKEMKEMIEYTDILKAENNALKNKIMILERQLSEKPTRRIKIDSRLDG